MGTTREAYICYSGGKVDGRMVGAGGASCAKVELKLAGVVQRDEVGARDT